MADAMKLVPVGTANDIALFLRKWGTVQAKEMADALDASPPAREEAPGEGAGVGFDLLPDEIDLLRIMRAAGRSNAEKARAVSAHLVALRTQAPDSWRPTEQEVENVLRCCDAMERSVERKGLPKSEADICVATDWLRKVCAALRPQTAESGK